MPPAFNLVFVGSVVGTKILVIIEKIEKGDRTLWTHLVIREELQIRGFLTEDLCTLGVHTDMMLSVRRICISA